MATKNPNTERNYKNRTLFHGDNLDFMRSMNSETVDLIATDPPFNKSRDFHATPDSLAAGAKFQDRWSWQSDVHESWTDQLQNEHMSLYKAIQNARLLHSDSMGAYLCFMAVRLLAMHRLLKPTGSIYLHCDPTASHYLKTVMDAIFGRKNFLNEIVWYYKTGGMSKRWFGRKHDLILLYSKTRNYKFRLQTEKSYLSHKYGFSNITLHEDEFGVYHIVGMRDVWDIPALRGNQPETYGYPTQKPLSLYERIINASSDRGDMVLDPFAGCATTCVAAEKLQRQWVGIDIWGKAQTAVTERLESIGIKAPKYTRKNRETRDQFLFADEFTFTSKLPERTDTEEVAVATLPTLKKALLAPWQRLTNAQIRSELEDAQANNEGLVVCAGCGRELEAPFMELDHITPVSSGGPNDISNRVLLCSPCNGRKSNKLTMEGLYIANKKRGIDWMHDENAARISLRHAMNRRAVVSMRD